MRTKPTTTRDPIEKAAESAESDFWTLRPPEDVRRMVARAIRDAGRDKAFWTWDCVRAGLTKYAGKKDLNPTVIKKTV
jgi:hypothetical protein